MSRIYLVESLHGSRYLVDAHTRQQALAHIASQELTVTLPSQHELVACLQDGMAVHRAVAPVQTDAFQSDTQD